MSTPSRPDITPALHTPGPWRVLDFSTGTKGFIAVVAHADRHVADVFPFGQRVAGTELAEHQANARLIAAAPDMLAALEYVADNTWCGADGEWHFKVDYDPQRVLDAIDKARGASQ